MAGQLREGSRATDQGQILSNEPKFHCDDCRNKIEAGMGEKCPKCGGTMGMLRVDNPYLVVRGCTKCAWRGEPELS